MRLKGLDFLRGIAILLVIFRHGSKNNILEFIGWGGVDLFFVLSGFLVSGLIFREYLADTNVNITQFLIRRGFKIYPPFYFFILITLLFNYFHPLNAYSLNQIINEVFYLQSYRPGMWMHTWSLAVEEHFYLVMALATFMSLKSMLRNNNKLIKWFLIAGLCISLSMRFYLCYPHRKEFFFAFMATHLRMDGILVGVLISYFYYFTASYNFFLKYKYVFLGLGALLISPVFFFNGGGYFMNTVGLTTMNLGFGLVVLFSLTGFTSNQIIISRLTYLPLTIISFIGVHSYSIYLWHLFSNDMVRLLNANQDSFLYDLILALTLGTIFSYTIEKPFLRIGEHLYKNNKTLPVDGSLAMGELAP